MLTVFCFGNPSILVYFLPLSIRYKIFFVGFKYVGQTPLFSTSVYQQMKIRLVTLSAIDSSVSELSWNLQNLKELCSFSLTLGQSGFCSFAGRCGGWGAASGGS